MNQISPIRLHLLAAMQSLDALASQLNAADLVTEPHLWITPGRRGGRVCIGGTNVTAEVVAERVWAEGDVECAMDEWGLSRDVVLMACWWWALHEDIEPFADVDTRCHYGEWCAWAHAYARNPGEAPDPPEVA